MHYRKAEVWQVAMDMVGEVYRLVAALPPEERFGLRSQITRAAVSVPCNVAEGWTRESPREKAHFMAVAHGSLAETETLLTLCERLGWLETGQTRSLRQRIDSVSRMLTTLRRRFRSA